MIPFWWWSWQQAMHDANRCARYAGRRFRVTRDARGWRVSEAHGRGILSCRNPLTGTWPRCTVSPHRQGRTP